MYIAIIIVLIVIVLTFFLWKVIKITIPQKGISKITSTLKLFNIFEFNFETEHTDNNENQT